jgi:NAD(P)-dependent dehydrogenase (short-subunit alcohol dehydrogenase family)
MKSQVILITGASRGMGLEMANHFAHQGHQVFGTSRRPSPAQKYSFTMLPLDVTDDTSVNAVIADVIHRAGRIDVLINNAGYLLFGGVEDTSMDEMKSHMETNFMGVVRMTSAVVPHMREQGGGKIINMSSLGGLVALPYNSAYNASKYALEGYSESIRYDLKSFGIFVSLIEPGNVLTDTLDTSIQETSASHPAYAELRERIIQIFRADAERYRLSPGVIVRAIHNIIEDPAPRLRYRVGRQAQMISLFRRWIPETMFETNVRRQFGLDKA